MKTFKISSLFKFIYIGVILLLLYSFYSDSEITQYNINGFSVLQTSTIEYPLLPQKIKNIQLNFKGISFDISAKAPVIIISDDNVKRNSKIKSINVADNILELNLENQVVMTFRVDNRGNRLTVNSNIPKVFPTIKEIVLPFHINSGFEMEENELSYKFFSKIEEFHLKHNDYYFIDIKHKRLHMLSDADKISTLTFSPLSNSDLPIAEQWYMRNRNIEHEELEISINKYINKVDLYLKNIFSSITFVPETGSWLNLPNSNNFTENSVISYLAQAMKQGNYSASLKRIMGLKNRYPYMFGYPSTPFLGNIVNNGSIGTKAELDKLSEIKTLIRSSDPKILQMWIPTHFFDGNTIDTKNLEELINNYKYETLSLESLAITLFDLMNILEKGKANSKSSNSVKEITDIILQKIKWDETGIYITDSNLTSNQELNFKIGRLLIKSSQYETSEYSKPIGEGLVRTYLNNSDENGVIRKEYDLDKMEFSKVKNNPEDTFLLLSDNPHLPHYYQNQGIKIWTISDSIEINKTSNDTRITISYPVDSYSAINSHFLTISGVENYNQLFFKGKLWRADSQFEKWGVGYYYDQSTKLMFFMPSHTKTREEIVISY